MPPIRARTAAGAEFSFPTRNHFAQAVARGRVGTDWQIYHVRARRWLPVTVHPAFSARPAAAPPVGRPPEPQGSALELIYPDSAPSGDAAAAPTVESDPLEGGPILTPEEIHRVLHAPRRPEPVAVIATVDPDHPTDTDPAHNLSHKALRAVPTFARALGVAAGLVNVRLP